MITQRAAAAGGERRGSLRPRRDHVRAGGQREVVAAISIAPARALPQHRGSVDNGDNPRRLAEPNRISAGSILSACADWLRRTARSRSRDFNRSGAGSAAASRHPWTMGITHGDSRNQIVFPPARSSPPARIGSPILEGEARARPGPRGALGHSCIVPWGARSPARSAAEGHAQTRSFPVSSIPSPNPDFPPPPPS